MSVCSVSILARGSDSASVSDIVAKCLKVLEKFPDLKWELTPMSTQIEGTNERILEAVMAMHEIPFGEGAPRVYTIIHLDDRRDKNISLKSKVASVKSKL